MTGIFELVNDVILPDTTLMEDKEWENPLPLLYASKKSGQVGRAIERNDEDVAHWKERLRHRVGEGTGPWLGLSKSKWTVKREMRARRAQGIRGLSETLMAIPLPKKEQCDHEDCPITRCLHKGTKAV